MNCEKWQVEISALLDGALSNPEERAVRRHLAECPTCAVFFAEHHQVATQLEKAAALRVAPPSQLWARIEAETRFREAATAKASQGRPRWDLFAWLRIPQFGYALGASMVLLLAGFLAVRNDSVLRPDPGALAKLDAFTLQTGDNPFLQPVEEANPFFSSGPEQSGNPFKGGGVTR